MTGWGGLLVLSIRMGIRPGGMGLVDVVWFSWTKKWLYTVGIEFEEPFFFCSFVSRSMRLVVHSRP